MKLKDVILHILHPTIWKRSVQILDEVHSFEHLSQRPFKNASLGSVLYHLDQYTSSLVNTGLASKRQAALTPEELAARGGRKAHEYLLSEDGLRKRTEVVKEIPDGVRSTV